MSVSTYHTIIMKSSHRRRSLHLDLFRIHQQKTRSSRCSYPQVPTYESSCNRSSRSTAAAFRNSSARKL
ncbi:hypothetical protein EMPG_16897 [Blastomyces silverae]|uniref:Uncharacterized protein n=1 Tax=Blastomyces silverae TaxID=2060906 RepID=A0A0H1B857_9EURO|nr:hypothetical protein EMPG_16897 [Blastomyces silverae]